MTMYSYSLGYKEDDDLMFDMEEDEMGRKGSSYKSSECLCCNNNNNSNQAQLPGAHFKMICPSNSTISIMKGVHVL